MDKAIQVSILLVNQHGRVIDLHLTKYGYDYLDVEEWTPMSLWGAGGGLEIVIEGYKVILRNLEFYVSLEAVDFLLNTLLYHHGQLDSQWLSEGYLDRMVRIFPSQNKLELHRVDANTYQLSYQKGNRTQNSPLRFFEAELLPADQLISAIHQALDDYFELFDELRQQYPEDPKTSLLQQYFQERRDLKEELF